MANEKDKELEEVIIELTHDGYEVFKVVTRAIMDNFEVGQIDNEDIKEGLEAALKVAILVEERNKETTN